MVSITPSAPVIRASLVHKPCLGASSSPVIALPTLEKKEKVRCSVQTKGSKPESIPNKGVGASLMAAAVATVSSPAMALVDERMSTEGTGLPFGLSNNLLGWILFGIFGLIWALYIVYASSLEEDEESGLSL